MQKQEFVRLQERRTLVFSSGAMRTVYACGSFIAQTDDSLNNLNTVSA